MTNQSGGLLANRIANIQPIKESKITLPKLPTLHVNKQSAPRDMYRRPSLNLEPHDHKNVGDVDLKQPKSTLRKTKEDAVTKKLEVRVRERLESQRAPVPPIPPVPPTPPTNNQATPPTAARRRRSPRARGKRFLRRVDTVKTPKIESRLASQAGHSGTRNYDGVYRHDDGIVAQRHVDTDNRPVSDAMHWDEAGRAKTDGDQNDKAKPAAYPNTQNNPNDAAVADNNAVKQQTRLMDSPDIFTTPPASQAGVQDMRKRDTTASSNTNADDDPLNDPEHILGRGGTSTVYLVDAKEGGERYALKVYNSTYLSYNDGVSFRKYTGNKTAFTAFLDAIHVREKIIQTYTMLIYPSEKEERVKGQVIEKLQSNHMIDMDVFHYCHNAVSLVQFCIKSQKTDHIWAHIRSSRELVRTLLTKLARTLFFTVGLLHAHNFAHGDLKMENIVTCGLESGSEPPSDVSETFKKMTFKVIDFEFTPFNEQSLVSTPYYHISGPAHVNDLLSIRLIFLQVITCVFMSTDGMAYTSKVIKAWLENLGKDRKPRSGELHLQYYNTLFYIFATYHKTITKERIKSNGTPGNVEFTEQCMAVLDPQKQLALVNARDRVECKTVLLDMFDDFKNRLKILDTTDIDTWNILHHGPWVASLTPWTCKKNM